MQLGREVLLITFLLMRYRGKKSISLISGMLPKPFVLGRRKGRILTLSSDQCPGLYYVSIDRVFWFTFHTRNSAPYPGPLFEFFQMFMVRQTSSLVTSGKLMPAIVA